MGEGSVGRGRDGRLPIQAEEGLGTERAREVSVSTCEEHLTPLLLVALVLNAAPLSEFLPSEFTSWNAVGQQLPVIRPQSQH